MALKQERRIFDEDGVRVVGKIGQADHVEAGVAQRLFVGRVLRARSGDVDRDAIEVRQRAFGEPRTDGSSEGPARHGPLTTCPPFITSRLCWTAERSRV